MFQLSVLETSLVTDSDPTSPRPMHVCMQQADGNARKRRHSQAKGEEEDDDSALLGGDAAASVLQGNTASCVTQAAWWLCLQGWLRLHKCAPALHIALLGGMREMCLTCKALGKMRILPLVLVLLVRLKFEQTLQSFHCHQERSTGCCLKMRTPLDTGITRSVHWPFPDHPI